MKLCLIDGTQAFTGSFNYTRAAATVNLEEITQHTDPVTVGQCMVEFTRVKNVLRRDEQLRALFDHEPF